MKHAFSALALGMGALTLSACGGSSDSTPPHSTPIAHHNTNHSTTPSTPSANVAPTFQATYHRYDAHDIKNAHKFFKTTNLDLSVTNNGQPVNNGIDLGKLPQGLSSHPLTTTINLKDSNQTFVRKETARIYQQPNSVVIGIKNEGGVFGQRVLEPGHFQRKYLNGNPTKTLPTAGTFNYAGKAFNENSEGSFNYAIDFGAKTGQGSFNLNGKSATLNKASLNSLTLTPDEADQVNFQGFGVRGFASGDYQGNYSLGVFGDQAQEVAGFVNLSETADDIILGGSKQ